jgi:hypothetical protein
MFDLADLVADGVGGALGAAAYLWLQRRHAQAGQEAHCQHCKKRIAPDNLDAGRV